MTSKLPLHTSLSDGQTFTVSGPDGSTTTYIFDAQTRRLINTDCSTAVNCRHGSTHIAEDPIPVATCDSPGLMSADDKCKISSMLGTRIGVLGYMGSGMPDDGGFLEGDLIFAAGSDFITLERVGNIIRWNVEIPIPLRCSCFTPGARVRMADGTTKAIQDIKVGDMVITHTGKIQRVKKLYVNNYNGNIKYWKVDKHSGENFGVTPNHPIYAIQRHAAFFKSGRVRPAVKELPQWINSSDISVNDLVVRRNHHDIVSDITTIDIMEHLDNIECYKEIDGIVYPLRSDTKTIDGMANGCPRFIKVDENFLRFIGYYAAEGSSDIINGVRISVHSEEMIAEDIGGDSVRLFSDIFGLEPSIYTKSNTENGKEIRVNCIPLVNLLNKWFNKGNDKHLPSWVLSLPIDKQRIVLISILKGDGYVSHHKSGNIRFELSLSSRKLIDQSIFIAERCGYEPSNPQPRFNNDKIRYVMNIASSAAPEICDAFNIPQSIKKISRERKIEGNVLRRISEETIKHYEGKVYNFEVENDNSYIVDGVVVHNCDECAELFLVQDTTAVDKVRPSNCAGKIPGLNVYNELSAYLVPKSAAINSNDIDVVLSEKDKYPSFVFKRYNDEPGLAEVHFILKRTSNTDPTSEIGWSMTPGNTIAGGVSTCVFNLGRDNLNNLMRFSFTPEKEPDLLGALYYKGHLITKKMGVITGYTENILGDNRYNIRQWSVLNNTAIGDSFTARNVWQYENPESATSGTNPQKLILDSNNTLLPIGTLVELWAFQVASSGGNPVYRWFFSKKPEINPNSLWSVVDHVKFGNELISRDEAVGGTGGVNASVLVSDVRNFEQMQWGLTGYDDPLIYNVTNVTDITDGSYEVNPDNRATIDLTVPGLVISQPISSTSSTPIRPVFLWHRSNHRNVYFKALIGRSLDSDYTPIDLLFRSSIDSWETKYAFVSNVDNSGSVPIVQICGVNFRDLPPTGTIRILTPGSRRDLGFNYSRKLINVVPAGPFWSTCTLTLIGYDGEVSEVREGDVVELVHQDYDAQVVRLEYTVEPTSNVQRLQFKVGTLNTGLSYDENLITPRDDFVRGLNPGYTVSAVYSQAGFFNGTGVKPLSAPEAYVMYDGGFTTGSTTVEFWNELEVMIRDGQLWIWWNKLLVPPDPDSNAVLPSPVTINTPYFNVNDGYGKIGLRMFPGAKVRSCELRTQTIQFNEFVNGNLKIV